MGEEILKKSELEMGPLMGMTQLFLQVSLRIIINFDHPNDFKIIKSIPLG